MKTLSQLCKPRQSVFDSSTRVRDTVLELSDFHENRIDPKSFFTENYLTDGMKELFKHAFLRFSGKSDGAVIKLTQAMGGGKTHCMISLGLLAQHQEYRKEILGENYPKGLGKVRVVAFTGRETDVKFGIWGSIAQQLGKESQFKEYYSPLKAPGLTAWVNLLKGEPLVILLDEIPFYLVNAKSTVVGNSDLCDVTVAALSNLFIAAGKNELSNVCIVISDLQLNWEEGSEKIREALFALEKESQKGAINLEPVKLNSDEVYQILKKRLFETLPAKNEIKLIAESYGKALKDAGQMNLTSLSPEKFAQQIIDDYPFHPGIKDLYVRFRQNRNFQQTRDLIRLMRKIVFSFYSEGGLASSAVLIHPHHIDLNNGEINAEFSRINPDLGNAISHDIASNGSAIAELIDHQQGGHDSSDIAKLIFVSSLANVQNAVIGVTEPEIVAYLVSPGRSLSNIPSVVDIMLNQKCWYIHKDNSGRICFKNTQNLVAKLRSYADGYSREVAIKDVKEYLSVIFKPERKDCYQDLLILPAVDDIQVSPDKVLLVLFEPHQGSLHPDLKAFYDRQDYKNRICFLSGPRETMDSLVQTGKEYKAIRTIIKEMQSEGYKPDTPQCISAIELRDKITLRLLSAAKETFTVLWYPMSGDLRKTDISMNFTDNKYRAEAQIRQTLLEKQKFTEDVDSEIFKKKCEQRLFTQKVMKWSDIKTRAANVVEWQWCHSGALDALKDKMVDRDQWRIDGGYVDKGPFPKDKTSVAPQELDRNEDTGAVTLRINPVHGDTVYYEIGGEATSSSARVPDLHRFTTSEMRVSFLCADSSGVHEQGEPYLWTNKVTLKKFVQDVDSKTKRIELQSAPSGATIRFTTDGSNPKTSGGVYDEPFTVKKPAKIVLAVAKKDGIESAEMRIDLSWKAEGPAVDPTKPGVWKRDFTYSTTKESFEMIERLKKFDSVATIHKISVVVNLEKWVEFCADQNIRLKPEQIEKIVATLREIYSDGQVAIDFAELAFPSGQHLLDFAADIRQNVKSGEVVQQ